MTTPSQIAVEAANEWLMAGEYRCRLCEVIQACIDKATAGKDEELRAMNIAASAVDDLFKASRESCEAQIEWLKEQRNRAAMEERQKYIPLLMKMVPIEDVKPLLDFNLRPLEVAQAMQDFLAKHGDKLK